MDGRLVMVGWHRAGLLGYRGGGAGWASRADRSASLICLSMICLSMTWVSMTCLSMIDLSNRRLMRPSSGCFRPR